MLCPINYKDPSIYRDVENTPLTTITPFLPHRAALQAFQRYHGNLCLHTELPACLRTAKPLYTLRLLSPIYTTPLYMFALPTYPYACAPLTNRGHPSGSPFGAKASRGALQPLRGPGTPAPTSAPSITCSHHLYDMSKINVVSAFSKTLKPLWSLKTPKMPSVATAVVAIAEATTHKQ
jgi:hypothetical protein